MPDINTFHEPFDAPPLNPALWEAGFIQGTGSTDVVDGALEMSITGVAGGSTPFREIKSAEQWDFVGREFYIELDSTPADLKDGFELFIGTFLGPGFTTHFGVTFQFGKVICIVTDVFVELNGLDWVTNRFWRFSHSGTTYAIHYSPDGLNWTLAAQQDSAINPIELELHVSMSQPFAGSTEVSTARVTLLTGTGEGVGFSHTVLFSDFSWEFATEINPCTEVVLTPNGLTHGQVLDSIEVPDTGCRCGDDVTWEEAFEPVTPTWSFC